MSRISTNVDSLMAFQKLSVNASRASELAAETRFDLLGVESGGDASMAGANPANAIDLMLE